MKVLLDTHALLWALAEDERLSNAARAIIEDPANEILVSVVSAWEIAVKSALGKLSIPDDLDGVIGQVGFVQRLVRFADCRRSGKLRPGSALLAG